jgi:hypothetical protein
VRQDRLEVTLHRPSDLASLDAGHSFRHHFGFWRNLYRNTDPAERRPWEEAVVGRLPEIERRLYDSRPGGTTPEQRDRLDAIWNAHKREERALQEPPRRPDGTLTAEQDWFWHSKRDARGDFAWQVEAAPAPTRAGARIERVRAHGRLNLPEEVIDWTRDVRHPPEARKGSRAEPGKEGFLIEPRYGADPAEPRNRTAPFRNSDWEEMERALLEGVRAAKDTNFEPPLDLSVVRETVLDRRGQRTELAPHVTVSNYYGMWVGVKLPTKGKGIDRWLGRKEAEVVLHDAAPGAEPAQEGRQEQEQEQQPELTEPNVQARNRGRGMGRR